MVARSLLILIEGSWGKGGSKMARVRWTRGGARSQSGSKGCNVQSSVVRTYGTSKDERVRLSFANAKLTGSHSVLWPTATCLALQNHAGRLIRSELGLQVNQHALRQLAAPPPPPAASFCFCSCILRSRQGQPAMLSQLLLPPPLPSPQRRLPPAQQVPRPAWTAPTPSCSASSGATKAPSPRWPSAAQP